LSFIKIAQCHIFYLGILRKVLDNVPMTTRSNIKMRKRSQ